MTWEKVEPESNIWKATQIGDVLEGTVTELRDSMYGMQYVITRADGTTATTPNHKALQCRAVNFEVGNLIRIVYMGEELPKIKGHKPTSLYDVYRQAAPPVEDVR